MKNSNQHMIKGLGTALYADRGLLSILGIVNFMPFHP